MVANYQTLLVTKQGGITTIAFNRSEKREHGGRPGLEQFVQKKLRPVSGVMSLERE